MERYRCDPQVLKACKIRKLYGCDGYYLGASCRCANDNQSIMAETEVQELQAYRKTGLTVERAAELGKADQEGRVVIKPYCPVRVGDKVYAIRDNAVVGYRVVYAIRDNAVVGYRVTEKSEGNGWMVISVCRHDGRLSFGLLDIGKTVFLTREEAEKVLEAENHE